MILLGGEDFEKMVGIIVLVGIPAGVRSGRVGGNGG
jgi:hypothetical protein